MAFSPDGKTVASGSVDTSVRVWDVASHRQVGLPLTGHTDEVASLAFSPDGKTLVSGSADDSVWLWDVASQRQVGATLTGHTDDVASVAFSPDARNVVSGSVDTSVRLWDVASHRQVASPSPVTPMRSPRWRSAPTARRWSAAVPTRRCGYGTSLSWVIQRHFYANLSRSPSAVSNGKILCRRAPRTEPSVHNPGNEALYEALPSGNVRGCGLGGDRSRGNVVWTRSRGEGVQTAPRGLGSWWKRVAMRRSDAARAAFAASRRNPRVGPRCRAMSRQCRPTARHQTTLTFPIAFSSRRGPWSPMSAACCKRRDEPAGRAAVSQQR